MTTPIRQAAAHLAASCGDRLRHDEPLAPMTTYRVGGRAALFVDAHSVGDVIAVAEAADRFDLPVLVVGRGSNMLVSDDGFDGIAVSIARAAAQIDLPRPQPTGGVTVTAGGGVALPVLARRTAAAGLTGFEWAVGVPGSIGGAVRMNAGGHGSDMAASLVDVDVVDLSRPDQGVRRLAAHELGLRFRASSLDPNHVVMSARLTLQVGDRASAEREIAEIVRWRRANQPGGQNCGSVFVNPVPGVVTAGGLVDGLGLRGFRIGTSWVSEKHANFVQAADGGTAADVRAVIEAVRARVAESTGHRLRSEVRLVGFDDADPSSFDDARPGHETGTRAATGRPSARCVLARGGHVNANARHEREPDRAALDELLRAFAADPDAAVAPAEHRVESDVHDDEHDDHDHDDDDHDDDDHDDDDDEHDDDEHHDDGIEVGDEPATVGLDQTPDVVDEPLHPEPSDIDPGATQPIRFTARDHESASDPEPTGGVTGPVDPGFVDPVRPIAEPGPGDTSTPPGPSIIRIDDYHGSAVIQPDDRPGSVPPTTQHEPSDGIATTVVISVDEDLPDPVYVEGNLDRDGSGTIVLIEDDDSADAMVPETERDVRRGIEPRLRERRVAVKRAQGRKRLKWFAVFGAVAFVAVGVLAVLGSSMFAIRADETVVTGNVYAAPAMLDPIIDDLVGTPALLVDTQDIERRIEAIPWVEDARVAVRFPHSATVDIRERQAMATYRGPDGRFRVLDRQGRVLDVLDQYPFAYVLIEGPDPVDLEPGAVAPQGYAAAAELAKNLTGSVRGRVKSIDVTADGSRLSMLLDDGSVVRFGEARDLFVKLVRLETILTDGQQRQVGEIDVSTNEATVPATVPG